VHFPLKNFSIAPIQIGVKVRRYIIVPALLMVLGAPIPAVAAEFAAGVDGDWQLRRDGEQCALVHGVDGYGEARFVAAAGSQPSFELQAHLDLHASGGVRVIKVAPAWHPRAPLQDELGVSQHVEGGGLVARGALASRMLLALRDGYDLNLSAAPWFGDRAGVDLTVGSTRFQTAYDEFVVCAKTNIRVAWQQVSRTRIAFGSNEHELDESDERLLKGIARFVEQDSTVKRVFVDGHTDDSGSKIGNYRLSKRRAEEVAEYLRSCGIDREVVVRFHGAAYPVADNGTFSGKAANRRATIRLERAEPQAVASKD
jgi:outer membrane protein OmpA-like peptidoglycan-associated protein